MSIGLHTGTYIGYVQQAKVLLKHAEFKIPISSVFPVTTYDHGDSIDKTFLRTYPLHLRSLSTSHLGLQDVLLGAGLRHSFSRSMENGLDFKK